MSRISTSCSSPRLLLLFLMLLSTNNADAVVKEQILHNHCKNLSSRPSELFRFLQFGHTNRKVLKTQRQHSQNNVSNSSSGLGSFLKRRRRNNNKIRTKFTITLDSQRPSNDYVWKDLYNDGRYASTYNSLSSPQEEEHHQQCGVKFNHDCVGITNPSLQIGDATDRTTTTTIVESDNHDNKNTIHQNVVTLTNEMKNDNDNNNKKKRSSSSVWWPSSNYGNTSPITAISTTTSTAIDNSQSTDTGITKTQQIVDGWRVLRYTRRIGKGEECYNRVRDAALNWEFHTGEDDIHDSKNDNGQKCMGIIRASSSSTRTQYNVHPETIDISTKTTSNHQDNTMLITKDHDPFAPTDDDISSNVLQIWSSPGKRKLATYSEALKLPFRLPFIRGRDGRSGFTNSGSGGGMSIYAVNPVAVVYDLIDQRGPKTTYTSTAYATLMGHLLRGEERVTVALRDDERHDDGDDNDLHYPNVWSDGSKDTSMARTKSVTYPMTKNLAITAAVSSSLPPTTKNSRKRYHNGRGGSSSRGSGDDVNSNTRGYVDVEILSFSRASPSLLGRLVWPIIGNMQDTFFINQLNALEDIAKSNL